MSWQHLENQYLSEPEPKDTFQYCEHCMRFTDGILSTDREHLCDVCDTETKLCPL